MARNLCLGGVKMKRLHYDDSSRAVLVFGSLSLAIATCFLAVSILRQVGEFHLTHYYFNYEHEFIRRGLVGEFLRLLNFPISNLSISLTYSMATVGFLLLLVLISAKVLQALPARQSILFVAFMMACPGLTLHYAYSSFGYLDIFQLLFVVMGLISIYLCRLLTALMVTALLGCAAVLIHESSLIVTIPVLLVGLAIKFPDQFGYVKAAAFFAGFLVFTIVVWYFGSADTMSFEEHVAILSKAAHQPNDISSDAVVVLHRNLADNVGLVLPWSPWWYGWQQLKFVVFAFPYLFFLVVCLRGAYKFLADKGHQLPGLLAIAAVFAPILLYPIGHDYFRWWSFAMTNFFLITLFLTAVHPSYLNRLGQMLTQHRNMIVLGITIGFMFGGIGGLVSFSVHTSPMAMMYRAVF